MPELPEVETTKSGISPYLVGNSIQNVIIRNNSLRWKVPESLPQVLIGQEIVAITRRAKYLLLHTPNNAVLIHLGMSGSLRITQGIEPYKKHDHVVFVVDNQLAVNYHDPRRFGSIHILDYALDGDIASHFLLDHLGPEPLSDAFTGQYLYRMAQQKKTPIKNFIMDQKIVVGVGNIYASESLFISGIHPLRAAGKISLARYEKLADAIKQVLASAINQGGTTLRDFISGKSEPGYFAQSLRVYGREAEACRHCARPIQKKSSVNALVITARAARLSLKSITWQ